MTEQPLDTLVERLHGHLEATGHLPLDREATRWVAEAEAVAGDARDIDDEAVVRERIGHVRALLSNVESTGHPEGDEHLREASAVAERIVE